MLPAFIACILSLAIAPPLSEQQRADLAAANDGADYREQAFYALVESVRVWPQSPATNDGEPIHLSFDSRTLNDHPADIRGDLFRITGELLQQTTLAPPYEDVSEWFVRDARSGEPVIVYVVHSDATAAFNNRQHVQIDARFYKRMRFTARDRQTRDYPAFVGRYPIAVAATQPASAPALVSNRGLDLIAVLAGPMALLVVVFLGLRLWIARKNRAAGGRFGALPHWERDVTADEVDDAAGLPDDPAEALAELRRRARAGKTTNEAD